MASMMPAVRKIKAGPGTWSFARRRFPKSGPNDVLMKVYAAGICGSDLLIQEDRHFYRAPVTQGHGFSGIAYKVGKNITRVKEGASSSPTLSAVKANG